jgi:type III secretory pathway component EscS
LAVELVEVTAVMVVLVPEIQVAVVVVLVVSLLQAVVLVVRELLSSHTLLITMR